MTRRELFLNPPAVLAFMVMIVSSAIASSPGGPVAMILVVALGAGLTAITLDTGSHLMALFGCAYLLLVGSLVLEAVGVDADSAVAWAGVAMMLLAYADAVRLAFAHRRHGVLDPAINVGVIGGLAVVGVASIITAAVVSAITEGRANANWLLVPVTLLLLTGGVVALTVAISRRPGEFDKRRWRPGERLAAPPRAASDDPSLRSSTPPPPTL